MKRLTMWPAVLGLALALIVVDLIQPTRHSLSYGSAILVLISLLGWVAEARAVAGPPPAVEPDEEVEEPAPGPSYWPIVLSLGIVGIAAGIVYDWDYGVLIVAIPMLIASAAAWMEAVRGEVSAAAPALPAQPAEGRAVAGPGGQLLMPVPPRILAAQAAGGAAIAIERVEAPAVSRRGLLRTAFWVGMGTTLAGAVGVLFDLLWPRGITGFGSVVTAGTVDQFAAGTKTQNFDGHFWLVNLTEAQGGPGFLALWWKCPHLGCTVPWRPDFHWPDPFNNDADKAGWFRCPCHGSTYNDAGIRVFGPAPRSMDHFKLTIDATKKITVDTGKVTKGSTDNPKFAVKA